MVVNQYVKTHASGFSNVKNIDAQLKEGNQILKHVYGFNYNVMVAYCS